MPKGPRLTDRDREMIAVIYNRNKGAKAEVIRQLASERLHRELGLSTVQREIADLRRNKARVSTDPLDDQWSIASVRRYPIDPKYLNFMLFIQGTFEENMPEQVKELNKKKGLKPPFLTNRLAIWINLLMPLIDVHSGYNADRRLYIPSPLFPDKYKWSEWVDDVVHVAMWYANYENSCELKGISPVNTVNFDAPNLIDMKLNIARYDLELWRKKGWSLSDKDLVEKLQTLDIRDLAPEGDK